MPDITGGSSQTLADRLASERMAVPEALQSATLLAEELRKVHESGRSHGFVSPSWVVLLGAGLELLPAPNTGVSITPYSAPEVVQGKPPDERSDIFAFGAIFYEMLTGRPAFQGDSAEVLSNSILNSVPPPIGKPFLDRVVNNCLAKDPALRWGRAQKLILELRVLSAGIWQTEPKTAERPQPDLVLRADMEQIEARMGARLVHCEQVLQEVSQRVSAMEQLLQASVERLGHLEEALAAAHGDSAGLRNTVAGDVDELKKTLQSQTAAIESVRMATAQTDDLVERVVEALGSLQSLVLERTGEPNGQEAPTASAAGHS
ncbi:MAG TPA: hypothetical protein VMH81_08405 [Bryobacteraceae bacterium]|nr:hypothetical protein [Bryobacteraceae bacterium]